MTEEKRNRLIAAVTVNVILLIAILAVVCIYQIVEMVTYNNYKKAMQSQIEQWQEEIESDRKSIEYFTSQKGLEDNAYWFGWVDGNNK